MIILIKYNNTSSKYLPTYQFLETIGRQVLHLVPSKLAFHNDGLVLAGKTFPFLHTGKIFQKRLFLVGFLWDFFYPVGNIDVQFQGLYFGLHSSKMLLAPLPPDTSGGNQPPTIEYKGEKEVFLFTNNTNLAQTIQSKYLQVQVPIHVYIYNNTPIAPIGTQKSNIGTYSVGILCVPKCTQIGIVIITTVMVFTCL